MRACSGRQPIIQTIMAGKMEMVLPAIYMMNRFMGICFSGASATSQQRFCRSRGRLPPLAAARRNPAARGPRRLRGAWIGIEGSR
uniref:Uncharacterized protein n=1 Tax=Strigops habroptila TaxID=2489341 RepID=A0A672TKU9_STRHB